MGGGDAYVSVENDFRRKTLNNFNSRSNKHLANHNVGPSTSNTSKQRNKELKSKGQQ